MPNCLKHVYLPKRDDSYVQKGVIETDTSQRTVRHPWGAISSRASLNNVPLGGYVQKGVIETDYPRRTVRHPWGAISSRASLNNMPLGGYVQKGVIETDTPRRTVRHPRGVFYERRSSRRLLLNIIKLDTHVVHFMEEGRLEDSFWMLSS